MIPFIPEYIIVQLYSFCPIPLKRSPYMNSVQHVVPCACINIHLIYAL